MRQTERLDKILSNMGFGTRSEIRKLVKQGAVTVNGAPVNNPALHVSPENDTIQIGDTPVRYRKNLYLMMNKPQGVVSATEDPREPTVVGLLAAEHARFAPFPVGRLDKDTEGLLLLTNDGQLAHRLLSPKKHVDKTYYAEVTGRVTEEDRRRLMQGVALDDGYVTMPAELVILESGPEMSRVELTIQEGKFHQVKRMFRALGKRVTYLKRIRMGNLALDPDLEPGQYRELTEEEVALLGGTP